MSNDQSPKLGEYQGITYSRRVHYHDTDAAGVVYHGNYFRFCEEARTDIFWRLVNMSLKDFETKYGIGFVISKAVAEYRRPVLAEAIVTVKTYIEDFGVVRTKYRQEIFVGDELCALIRLDAAAVSSATFKPAKMPQDLISAYKAGFGL